MEGVDSNEGQCGSEDIHGLICLAAQLAFEVNIIQSLLLCVFFYCESYLKDLRLIVML